jgi:hypothetical protein
VPQQAPFSLQLSYGPCSQQHYAFATVYAKVGHWNIFSGGRTDHRCAAPLLFVNRDAFVSIALCAAPACFSCASVTHAANESDVCCSHRARTLPTARSRLHAMFTLTFKICETHTTTGTTTTAFSTDPMIVIPSSPKTQPSGISPIKRGFSSLRDGCCPSGVTTSKLRLAWQGRCGIQSCGVHDEVAVIVGTLLECGGTLDWWG